MGGRMGALWNMIASAAERSPDESVLLGVDEVAFSRAGLADAIAGIDAFLSSLGLFDDESRIAVAVANGPLAAVATLALVATRCCVPIDPGARPEEALLHLRRTRARALLCDDPDSPAAQTARTAGLVVLDLRAAVRRVASSTTPRPRSRPTDRTALVLLTSGATASAIAAHLQLSRADRAFNAMPLFHAHGLVGSLMSSIVSQGSVICAPSFDPMTVLDSIERHHPTWMTASPTIYAAFATIGDAYRQRLPSHRFRFLRSASAPMPRALIERIEAAIGAPLIESYGMSETATQVASNPLPPLARKAGTVGVAAGAQLRIGDGQGRSVPPGTEGEIAVLGPGLMRGYEDDDAANAAAFLDGGWFRTGDLGRLDEDGWLTVTGRLKEQINRGGEKISPREIDEALCAHPDVAAAAAFGVPHPTLGEAVAAAVVPRPGVRLDVDALAEFLRDRLSDSKVPIRFETLERLPTLPGGKVARAALSRRFAAATRATVDAGPRNALEATLRGIWMRALGREDIGIDDGFFDLGGDSLVAMRLLADVEAHWDRVLPLAALLRAPTVRRLADVLRDALDVPGSCIVPVGRPDARPAYYVVGGWGAQILVFERLARELGEAVPLAAVDLSTVIRETVGPATIEAFAERIAADIDRVQPSGDLRLMGFSFGGLVMYEVARRLQLRGRSVPTLVVLDTNAPGYPVRLPGHTRVLRHVGRLVRLGPVGAVGYLREHLSARAAARQPNGGRQLFSSGEGGGTARQLQAVSELMLEARARYVPGEWQGGLTVVRAVPRPFDASARDDDPQLGWGRLVAGPIVVRPLASEHNLMLHPEHAAALAAILRATMDGDARPAHRDAAASVLA
jgi:acyl-CoA synthetase (AMP-forming)/AMP-acid ligase II/thioesterase domain-containing protein/acyl carrier protein